MPTHHACRVYTNLGVLYITCRKSSNKHCVPPPQQLLLPADDRAATPLPSWPPSSSDSAPHPGTVHPPPPKPRHTPRPRRRSTQAYTPLGSFNGSAPPPTLLPFSGRRPSAQPSFLYPRPYGNMCEPCPPHPTAQIASHPRSLLRIAFVFLLVLAVFV